MRKIIFCDNSIGSLLNFRGNVINYFCDQGDDVILIYPRITHKQELIDSISLKCRTFVVDVSPSRITPIGDIRYMKDLYRIYRKERPDIVFHYTIKPNIFGTIAALIAGVHNRISMVAGLGYVFEGNSIYKVIARFIYKIGLRLSTKVITLNKHNKDILLKGHYVNIDKIVLFDAGEGVDLSKYRYCENSFESLHFLMVARMLYSKGYDEFVKAAEIVKQQYPNVSFELLGPIDSINPMRVPKDVIDRDTKRGIVKYLGETRDVASFLNRSGVVVVLPSSYHEGMNRSLMEALAIGRPIITSDIAGCKEMVEDGINGFLVRPKDPITLANAILKFIKLPDIEKKKMSVESYNIAVNKFDIKNVINEYDKILP
jgi:glycosyltransferase involved in cell wall biosynthesis